MRRALLLILWALVPALHAEEFLQVRDAWQPSYAYLLARDGEVLQGQRMDFHGLRLPWVALDTVSPAFLQALIAIEDQGFEQHHGVDWRALLAAVWQNLSSARRRGASTISMQLASLLEHRDEAHYGRRGWWDKWRQMRAAQTLEQHWRKREILEAYVNHVSFRGELRGIGAASAGLFDKQPSGHHCR